MPKPEMKDAREADQPEGSVIVTDDAPAPPRPPKMTLRERVEADPEGLGKRVPELYIVREENRLREKEAKEQLAKDYADRVRARKKPDEPDCHPHRLRPNEAIVKTFRLVSDLPEEVLCAPRHFKLSLADVHVETVDASDTMAMGDILEIYHPETKRLRFRKVAAAVSIESRSVTWEDETSPGE